VRLPLANVYRAFPELDRFSDEECDEFVMRANHHASSGDQLENAFLQIACVVLGFVAAALLIAAGAGLVRALSSPLYPMSDRMASALVAMSALTLLVLPCVGSLVGRDLWLRRAIRRLLRRTTCPHCHYSLLGLKVARVMGDHVLRCPECGQMLRLEDYALTPADLLAVMDVPVVPLSPRDPVLEDLATIARQRSPESSTPS
jgi:hypothetical protein